MIDLDAIKRRWPEHADACQCDRCSLIRESYSLATALEAATARVRELEDQANREGMTPHETFCFAAGRTKGAADERAAVVAWICNEWPQHDYIGHRIEAGEHRKEQPRLGLYDK